MWCSCQGRNLTLLLAKEKQQVCRTGKLPMVGEQQKLKLKQQEQQQEKQQHKQQQGAKEDPQWFWSSGLKWVPARSCKEVHRLQR